MAVRVNNYCKWYYKIDLILNSEFFALALALNWYFIAFCLHCIAIAFWIGIGIVLQKVLFFKKLYNIILALHSFAAVLKPAQACLVNYLSKFYIIYQT